MSRINLFWSLMIVLGLLALSAPWGWSYWHDAEERRVLFERHQLLTFPLASLVAHPEALPGMASDTSTPSPSSAEAQRAQEASTSDASAGVLPSDHPTSQTPSGTSPTATGGSIIGDPATSSKIQVSVVITALGLRESMTDRAIAQNPHFSLAFSPYSSSIERWTAPKNRKDRVILAQIPAMLTDEEDQDFGPFALSATLDQEENLSRIDKILAMIQTPDAVVMDTRASLFSSKDATSGLLERLRSLRLPLVLTSPIPAVLRTHLDESGVRWMECVGMLDGYLSSSALSGLLDSLGAKIRTGRPVCLILPAYPTALDQLAQWIPSLPQEASMVPITEYTGYTANRLIQGGQP